MKQRIVFFGAGNHCIPVIEHLKKYNPILGVTTERSGKLLVYLKKNNIPYLISSLKEKKDIEKIRELKPTLGILASYGAIIPESLLNLFPNGILNIHPSLLPLYRGPSPVQQMIFSGDTKTGVTIIRLDSQVDHGPIIKQEEFALSGRETSEELLTRLFIKGAELIARIIDAIENGEKISFENQDDKLATFTKKISRNDGFFSVDSPPDPQTRDRMIRAFHPWPGVWTEFELYGKKRRIKLLPEGKIQVEGKNAMTTTAFVNGYQQEGKDFLSRLGLVF